ncbi:MAG TPA: hypothetical protein VFV43_01320 [Limnobacter sp.]|nr:hypothetical protein [Limnobacter sp.]
MSKQNVKTPLPKALVNGSHLRAGVEPGLAAVASKDRPYFDKAAKRDLLDSLDLDAALKPHYPSEHRWDYLLGHRLGGLIAVEPHPANQAEVSTVIAKKQAAVKQLNGHLKASSKIQRWLWVASGNVGFAFPDKALLRLNQEGIEFVGRKVLPKNLP